VPWNQPIELPNTKEIWLGGKELGTSKLGGRLSSTTTTTSPIVKPLDKSPSPFGGHFVGIHEYAFMGSGEGYYAYSLKAGGILHLHVYVGARGVHVRMNTLLLYTS
jgi:hypothetical protein